MDALGFVHSLLPCARSVTTPTSLRRPRTGAACSIPMRGGLLGGDGRMGQGRGTDAFFRGGRSRRRRTRDTCRIHMSGGGLADLRNRIATVQIAAKVTRAMRLVSAAKIKRSADSALSSQPFVQSLQQVMTTVLKRLNTDGRSFQELTDEAVRGGGEIDTVDEFLLNKVYRALQDPQPTRRVLLIVIGGDRGFCGIYNRLVLSMADRRIRELIDLDFTVELCCVGRVTERYFRRNFPQLLIVNSFRTVTRPDAIVDLALNVSEEALMDFISDEVDRVEMVYTRFVSMLKSTPSIRTFLPLNPLGMEWDDDEIFQLATQKGQLVVERQAPPKEADVASRFSENVRFEQHPLELLSAMMPLYVRHHVIRAIRESTASELAARLTAMRTAEDNANKVEHELRLQFNRKRQEFITMELNQIVSGINSIQDTDNLL